MELSKFYIVLDKPVQTSEPGKEPFTSLTPRFLSSVFLPPSPSYSPSPSSSPSLTLTQIGGSPIDLDCVF